VQRIERAWEELRKHPLTGPLVQRAKLKVISYQPQVPQMFTTVSSAGEIFANPFNYPRTIPEWSFVLAHSLLHLAFGHVNRSKRGIIWNIACDCMVNEFLSRMRIGTQPEKLLRLPPGMPNDEDKLFTMWTQSGTPAKGETTNGSAMDMTISGPSKANWADIFARAIRRAAQQSLSAAAGDDVELSQAYQARAWFVKNYPLLGAVLQHFKIVEDAKLCERMGVRIAAVNAKKRELILNPGWALSPQEYRYIMAHMALHASLQHVYRRKGRDGFIWNAACDYCINDWLSKITLIQKMCQAPGEGTLLSVEYQNQRPETIYDALMRNEKAARKLVTYAGEHAMDVFGMQDEEAGKGPLRYPGIDRLLLDALLRGYQIHTESGRGSLPYTLIDEIKALEHPPLPWDVQLARWFDEHVPPVEKIRTYGRPSRRQSSTPNIARPRYVWPDEETAMRGTFGLLIDCSGNFNASLLRLVLGAISSYALSRNIAAIRVMLTGGEMQDLGPVSAEDLAQRVKPLAARVAENQPAVAALEFARDFPVDAPLLIVTGLPCDRIATSREHAFLVRDGGRLPFQSSAPLIEVSEDEGE